MGTRVGYPVEAKMKAIKAKNVIFHPYKHAHQIA